MFMQTTLFTLLCFSFLQTGPTSNRDGPISFGEIQNSNGTVALLSSPIEKPGRYRGPYSSLSAAGLPQSQSLNHLHSHSCLSLAEQYDPNSIILASDRN